MIAFAVFWAGLAVAVSLVIWVTPELRRIADKLGRESWR